MKGRSKKNNKNYKTDLENALIKKALGYDATEVVEEYSSDNEGEIRLLKKKITTKNVPPDMTALKFLLDEGEKDLTKMTDEELFNEKVRLLNILKEIQNN